jgi:excisionase family DNA binding protein
MSLRQQLQRADKQLAACTTDHGERFDYTLSVISQAHKLALKAGAADAAKIVENVTRPLSPAAGRRLIAAMLSTLTQEPSTLTPTQAAARVRVSPDTVRDWINSRQLKASNVGKGKQRGRYRIAVADLDTFMASRQPEPPAPRRKQSRCTSYQRDFA